MALTLLEAAKRAVEEIGDVHQAFGAPGDRGYETREGKALFSLYRFREELKAAIACASDATGEQLTADEIEHVKEAFVRFAPDSDFHTEISATILRKLRLIAAAPAMLAAILKTRTNLAGLSRDSDDVFAAMVRRLDGAIALAAPASIQPVQGK